MNRTTMVIQVLDDSHNIRIGYHNWGWLNKNVERLNIFVCVGDCSANIYDVINNFGKDDAMVIQYGIEVQRSDCFNPQKEALLLKTHRDGYLVYLYLPNKELKN